MKKIFIALLSMFVIAQTGILAQTVDEIVQKHIEAIGGVENLKGLKSMIMKGTVEIQPGMSAPVTMQVINNKAIRMDINVMGTNITQAVNDKTGWAIVPFTGSSEPQPLSEEEVQELKKQTELSRGILSWKDKGIKIESEGTEQLEGKDCFKLKFTDKDGKSSYKYFDKGTYYMVKEIKYAEVEGQQMEIPVTYSDFRKTDSGLVFAYTMVNEMNGGPMKWESIEVNPKIDESVFKIPTK
ncbi:MAG TPA: hypothetical protein PKN57_08190 [Saprospiraceae bacterium]|nr:outer membrane lipoprotein-sorting protein [Saprospiraceae bacterium]MCC6688207.1 hypothetical protein [Saprospiraceae bacterium]HMV23874.1 hypothetical protein [Saprospiraceae bacterium]HMX86077.1 hypothetical protein [Saprospiraceae bacterium]HMZ74236.1 hypothetical protein [Saprospiraceae bacterium]